MDKLKSCDMLIGRGHKRYWWRRLRVLKSRKCVVMKCMCLERNCCSQCVFMCLMHIGREHKRYWWTSLRVVEARTCVVIKCICICVNKYVTCVQARRHVFILLLLLFCCQSAALSVRTVENIVAVSSHCSYDYSCT